MFLIVCPIAATIGNVVGYWIGYRAGPIVFDRPESKMFKPEYVAKSCRRSSLDRFGWATISSSARFVPIVRTVATVMAGVAKMRFASSRGQRARRRHLGRRRAAARLLARPRRVRPVTQGLIDYLVIAVVLLSLVPATIHYLRGRRPAKTVADWTPGVPGKGRLGLTGSPPLLSCKARLGAA